MIETVIDVDSEPVPDLALLIARHRANNHQPLSRDELVRRAQMRALRAATGLHRRGRGRNPAEVDHDNAMDVTAAGHRRRRTQAEMQRRRRFADGEGAPTGLRFLRRG